MKELKNAIMGGKFEKIKAIAKKNFDLNSYFKVGETRTTALILAAYLGKTQSVQALLKLGADVHIGGDSPLMLAARQGYMNTCEMLLENGADINAQQGKAFLFAILNGKFSVLKVFKRYTDYKAIMNNCNFVVACRDGNLDLAKKSVAKGADVHAWNDAAVRQAIQFKKIHMFRFLLDECQFELTKDIIRLTERTRCMRGVSLTPAPKLTAPTPPTAIQSAYRTAEVSYVKKRVLQK